MSVGIAELVYWKEMEVAMGLSNAHIMDGLIVLMGNCLVFHRKIIFQISIVAITVFIEFSWKLFMDLFL